MDNQTHLISQLTGNEFNNLNRTVFGQYNQAFKLLSVMQEPGRKSVKVRLHSGAEVEVKVGNDQQ